MLVLLHIQVKKFVQASVLVLGDLQLHELLFGGRKLEAGVRCI